MFFLAANIYPPRGKPQILRSVAVLSYYSSKTSIFCLRFYFSNKPKALKRHCTQLHEHRNTQKILHKYNIYRKTDIYKNRKYRYEHQTYNFKT